MRMWDADAAKRYEAWFQTPKGLAALKRERELVAGMISCWPRRGRTLLEAGCGTGVFLESFYRGGFDVTGLDMSQHMLDVARERMGTHADLRLGNAEHMPFDDDSFDYVVMVAALECMENPEAALAEAFRVAMRGVLVVFLNAWSLYRAENALRKIHCAGKSLFGAANRRQKHTLARIRWFSPYGMARLIGKVSDKYPSSFRSALFSPSFVWRAGNMQIPWLHALPFGAVAAMRVDMDPATGTALPLPMQGIVPATQCFPASCSERRCEKT